MCENKECEETGKPSEETSNRRQTDRQPNMHLSVLTVSRLQNQSLTCYKGREVHGRGEKSRGQGRNILKYGERGKSEQRTLDGIERVPCPYVYTIKTVEVHSPIFLPPPPSYIPESPTCSQHSSPSSSSVLFDHRSPYAFTVNKDSRKRHQKYNMGQSGCVILSFICISLLALALVLIYLSQSTNLMKEGMSEY